MPTKENFDQVMREISKLKEETTYCKEDMQSLRELLAKLQKDFDDYAEATNKDIGTLKGNFKWAEDQISMIKKMLRKVEASAGAGGGNAGKNSKENSNDWEKLIKQLQADFHLHVQSTEKNFNTVHVELSDKASR
jgi:predicted  nucleic acid-binding Zn-ribbon protein